MGERVRVDANSPDGEIRAKAWEKLQTVATLKNVAAVISPDEARALLDERSEKGRPRVFDGLSSGVAAEYPNKAGGGAARFDGWERGVWVKAPGQQPVLLSEFVADLSEAESASCGAPSSSGDNK